jgi:rhodanese-related sulfurtransferase
MSVLAKLFGSSTASGVGPAEAHDLLRSGALLLDVREQGEWDAGHAPKARHHPLRRLPGSMDRLPTARTIVVVCRSGNRSARATKMLTKAGLDAVNLTGGMTAWKAAGLPLVSSRGKKGTVA